MSIRDGLAVGSGLIKERFQIVECKRVIRRPPVSALVRGHLRCGKGELDDIIPGRAKFSTDLPCDRDRAGKPAIGKPVDDGERADNWTPPSAEEKEHPFWMRGPH